MKTRYFIFLLLLPIFVFCEKKAEESMVENAVRQQEMQGNASVVAVNYGEIMNQLFELEQAVIQAPEAILPREKLLNVAIDTTRKKLYAVGEGLPDSTAKTAALAKQSAERAALVDAQRWALLTLRWQKDISRPHFTDKISGQVPPFQIIQRAELPENKIYLMIEIAL